MDFNQIVWSPLMTSMAVVNLNGSALLHSHKGPAWHYLIQVSSKVGRVDPPI